MSITLACSLLLVVSIVGNTSSVKDKVVVLSFHIVSNEALLVCNQDLDLHAIILETERRGMTFDQLLTMPEQDEWVYSDGKSTTCVAFVLEMYKEAGIFGPLANSIQVTEFTVSPICP